MKSSPRPRKMGNLSESVLRQLNVYALGATTAGVGMLALAQPARAEIVYTAAHVSIPLGEHYTISLGPRHIGRSYNFVISWYSGLGGGQEFSNILVKAFNFSSSIVQTQGPGIFARALRSGMPIGPRQRFRQGHFDVMGSVVRSGTSTRWAGPWANGGEGVKNHYLGLKFSIDGQTHYGWARLSVTASSNGFESVSLTGYAYETIPKKPIIAGRTKGADDVSSVQPSSLGHLAIGASAISPRRLKKTATVR
jgi:hypothetical protein